MLWIRSVFRISLTHNGYLGLEFSTKLVLFQNTLALQPSLHVHVMHCLNALCLGCEPSMRALATHAVAAVLKKIQNLCCSDFGVVVRDI